VPVEQARLLDWKMNDAGAAHTLVAFHGQGHGFRGDAHERAMLAMWSFFDKHLKPAATKAAGAAWTSLFNGRNLDGWIIKCLPT